MQQTSKWEKHLPYLHVGTLSVHNSFSENYKNSKKKTSIRTLSSQLCACLWTCGKVLGHFFRDPGPMNATINRQKIDFVT